MDKGVRIDSGVRVDSGVRMGSTVRMDTEGIQYIVNFTRGGQNMLKEGGETLVAPLP